MLRKVKLKNFIHFEKEQEVSFKNGPNFLIGENHTGKSSLFEAVRRCMSLSKSNGLSCAHDPGEISYVNCYFENRDNPVTSIRSCMIRLPKHTASENDDEVLLKAVVINDKLIHADLVKKNTDRELVCEILKDLKINDIFRDTWEIRENVQEILHGPHFKKIIGKFTKSSYRGNYTETECETQLKQHVDQCTLIIFPFGSISPLQWTESDNKSKCERKKISEEVSLKAEIIKWYLNGLDNRNITKDEQEKEDRYFDLITENSGFRFKIRENIVSVENRNFRKRHLDSETLLLKIPEGIYEAKKLSILLAVRRFTTICIDDTERGMHPQMIARARDLVLMEIESKIVLLITHNPTFLARWNLSRTLLFQRYTKNTSECFRMISLDTLNEVDDLKASDVKKSVGEMGAKTLQLITSNNSSHLFFARRVFFVEGKTEFMFMSVLKETLLNDKTLLQKLCPEETIAKDLKRFICSLHVVSMDGSANMFKFHNVCFKLNIPHYFMLDYDALSNNIPEKLQGENKQQKLCKGLHLNIGSDANKCEQILKDVTLLEKEAVFVWKNSEQQVQKFKGTIETAVQSLCQKMPKKDLKQYFAKRHVVFSTKLFTHKDLSNNDVDDIVKTCLEEGVKVKENDFYRLIQFIINKSIQKDEYMRSDAVE